MSSDTRATSEDGQKLLGKDYEGTPVEENLRTSKHVAVIKTLASRCANLKLKYGLAVTCNQSVVLFSLEQVLQRLV